MPYNDFRRVSWRYSFLAGSDPGEIHSSIKLAVPISGQVPHPQVPGESVLEGKLGILYVAIVGLEKPFQHKSCRSVGKVL